MNASDDSKNIASSLIQKFTSLKTIGSVAQKLVRMIESDTCSLKEFEDVIKVDPILVLRLLKLVNSAYFGLRSKIKNIAEAVAYIGMDNLRNLLILDAIKHLFKDSDSSNQFSRNRLWLHSAVTSVCSQMISERVFAQKGEDAFLCGLLHDIGLIVEDQAASYQFETFCSSFEPEDHDLIGYERLAIGTDHQVTGSLLTKEWGLRPEICKAVETHHKNLKQIEPESLSGLLQIAEYLIIKLDYGAFPEVKPLLKSQSLLMHMKENIITYKVILEDLPDEIQKARDIYSIEDV